MRRAIAVAALLVVPATILRAQERERPRGRGEAFRMVDAYIVSNLQESLGLSDDQFVELLPLVKRLQTDRRALVRRRLQTLGEMRKALASGGATQARVEELLTTVKAIEGEERSTLEKDMAAIDAVLTPLQQAKYRLLELEVERRIRDLMQELRQSRRRRAEPAPADRP